MDFGEKINNLLLLLEDVNNYEIHDFFVVMLINDLLFEISENNIKCNKKFNISSLEKYILFMDENKDIVPNGLVIKNSMKENNLNESFRKGLLEMKNMMITMNNLFYI